MKPDRSAQALAQLRLHMEWAAYWQKRCLSSLPADRVAAGKKHRHHRLSAKRIRDRLNKG